MKNKLIIGAEVETKSFDKQIDYIRSRMEEIEDKLKKADMQYEVGDTQKLEKDYEKLNNQLGNLIKKQNELNRKDYSGLKNSIENVSKSVEKVTHKLTKMALAVFGIRSAFSFVRKSINTITSDDEQLKADIDYMRNALAYTLEPVVRGIVELAKQLMFYIAYIVKRWTGKNIFENANKSLKSSVGSAKALNKELSKTVAGFDEMNTLQSTSSSGDTGGGGGTIAPSFDLSNIKEPNWSIIYSWTDKLKEIFNNTFDVIKENIKQVMEDLGFSEEFIATWEFAVEGVKKIIDGLLDIIGGVLEIIMGLLSGDTEKVKEGFNKLISGIINILLGLVQTIIGIFGMIIVAIWDVLIKPIISFVSDKIVKPIANLVSQLWQGIKLGIGSAIEFITNKFLAIVNFFKNIISTIIGLFKTIGTKAGNILGSAFKAVVNGVLKTIETILNTPIKAINGLIGIINKIPGINLGKLQTFNLPRLAKGGIVNNPGNGVFMGSYIAGEKGAEAVIPLNEETLDRLGLAFARHTTINATIPVYAYNRQVAREIKRIEANQNFAMNR